MIEKFFQFYFLAIWFFSIYFVLNSWISIITSNICFIIKTTNSLVIFNSNIELSTSSCDLELNSMSIDSRNKISTNISLCKSWKNDFQKRSIRDWQHHQNWCFFAKYKTLLKKNSWKVKNNDYVEKFVEFFFYFERCWYAMKWFLRTFFVWFENKILRRCQWFCQNDHCQSVFTKNSHIVIEYFYRRFFLFFKKIIRKKFNVNDHWYRFEWQNRDNDHIHDFLWIKNCSIIDVKQEFVNFWNVKIVVLNLDVTFFFSKYILAIVFSHVDTISCFN